MTHGSSGSVSCQEPLTPQAGNAGSVLIWLLASGICQKDESQLSYTKHDNNRTNPNASGSNFGF
jgi:hypothetical protein